MGWEIREVTESSCCRVPREHCGAWKYYRDIRIHSRASLGGRLTKEQRKGAKPMSKFSLETLPFNKLLEMGAGGEGERERFCKVVKDPCGCMGSLEM